MMDYHTVVCCYQLGWLLIESQMRKTKDEKWEIRNVVG